MAFRVPSQISEAAASGGGGYLNPSKVPSGGSVRFHILSEEPMAFFECWGEAPDGKVKPFRFLEDPSPMDITRELGDYSRRMNREGTAPEPVKAALAFAVYNFEKSEVEICQLTQKGLIRELDEISQMPDYEELDEFDFVLGKTGSGLTTEYTLRPVPMKKGTQAEVAQAWSDAKAKGFDITRLLSGGNPFKAEG